MPLEAWLENAHTSSERATQVRELIEQDEYQDLSGTHRRYSASDRVASREVR